MSDDLSDKGIPSAPESKGTQAKIPRKHAYPEERGEGPTYDLINCPDCDDLVTAKGGMGRFSWLIAILLFFAAVVPALIWVQIFYKPFRCTRCGLKLTRRGLMGLIFD